MAIEKSTFKRMDSEFSPASRVSMSSGSDDDDGELEEFRREENGEEEEDDEFDDADSGAGSDDFDLLELGETGAEFCQVGDVTCGVPMELYDLSGLEEILSVDVWNECLTEEERLGLASYLPDMDQETCMRTLKEVFTGGNIHFGSPIKKLFEMMKGGLCEPRVALYRQGLNFFEQRQHYHLLRKYHNEMVGSLHQMREAWLNCRGYGIEEKLQVLSIMKSQKSLMYEKMGTDLSEEEQSGEALRGRRPSDKKPKKKMGQHSDFDFTLRGHSLPSDQAKRGKQNPKGKLKLTGSMMPNENDLVAGFPPRHNKLGGYDMDVGVTVRDRVRCDDDLEDPIYGMGFRRDRTGSYRADEYGEDSFMGVPQSYGRTKSIKRPSEILPLPSSSSRMRMREDYGKWGKYLEHEQQYAVGNSNKSLKQLAPQPPQVDFPDHVEPFWHNRTQREAHYGETSFKYDEQNSRSKKWKARKESPDLSYRYTASSPQISERLLQPEFNAKSSVDKAGGNYIQNGGLDMSRWKDNRIHMRSEETESESSMQSADDDDDEINPVMRNKLAYPSGVMEDNRYSLVKPGSAKKPKLGKADSDRLALEGFSYSKKLGDIGESPMLPDADRLSLKVKKKSKASNRSTFCTPIVGAMEERYLPVAGKFNDGAAGENFYSLSTNGRFQGDPAEQLHLSSQMEYPTERKKKKKFGGDPSVPRSNLLHDYVVDEANDPFENDILTDARQGRSGKRAANANDPVENDILADARQGRSGKRGANAEKYSKNRQERFDASGSKYGAKKRKEKDGMIDLNNQDEEANQLSHFQAKNDDSTSFKKRGKRKLESDAGVSGRETCDQIDPGEGTADVELETRPQKKPFVLITPTIHTGFSFSVMHLLSAVRMALIAPILEDSLEGGKPREAHVKYESENLNLNNSENSGPKLPSLTVQEIVNRLRSNPGDPSVLETQEPLQDLVRGVLKIFSSKTAPLGAKGWKSLVSFERCTKSWFWIGPVCQSSSDHETVEELTSPEAWGLPHKMLVKLVDAFANWLKNGQETLQQIGSLPVPPVSLMQINLDEKERFRDLRAQKSLNTISPSHEEVRAYFRKEEILRYSIPDRAFAYTAADGKRTIVAPLRRCGGKPTSKARDHFMLKRDRPPHVTILCIVRDAAARLPGSIGTRADVCTLIRDSQYIVEDVTDAQINQVVSGALDRLHYERDPCVQFDGERKLWVYLHRERDEEDFEDDGTSSTKKWRRPKKNAAEQSDQGAVTVAHQGTTEQSGADMCSDLNVEPSCMDDDKKEEFSFIDAGQNVEECVDASHDSEGEKMQQNHAMAWEPLDMNPLQDDSLHCEETVSK